MHRGVIGATNLNIELQKALNPDKQGITHGSRTFKLGDKVMQITNNYDKEVFNGDIGWVSRIDQKDKEVTIDFDGRLVSYDYSDLDEVVLAYTISVHICPQIAGKRVSSCDPTPDHSALHAPSEKLDLYRHYESQEVGGVNWNEKCPCYCHQEQQASIEVYPPFC